MSLVADRCICLRKFEYSETSQILTLLARGHGLVRVMAKGAHRKTKAGASKFGGGLDLLDVGEAVIAARTDKDLSTLTEWNLREGHPELRKSLRGLYLGFYAAELVSLLIEEHDPHPELYDRVEGTLLDLSTPRVEQAFLAFELDLLRETGYLPEFSACVSCGARLNDRSAASLSFTPERGGMVCRNCEGAFPNRMAIDASLVAIVQYVLNLSQSANRRLPALTRRQSDPLNRLLAEHIQHTLGRRLRMASWIRGERAQTSAAAARVHS